MTPRILIFAVVYLCSGCSQERMSGVELDMGTLGTMEPIDMAVSERLDQSNNPTPEDAGIAGRKVAYITLGHRFSNELGVPGRGLSMFRLSERGELNAERTRLEATHPVTALDYVGRSGTFVVASEDGHYSQYDAKVQPPNRLYTNQIEASGVVSVSGGRADSLAIVSRDSSATGGIYWFDLGAGLDVAQFVQMPLAYAATQCPDDGRWVVIGGQTTFEPLFNHDVHIINLNAGDAEVVARGDVTDEIFDLRTVAITADCRYVVFANQSLFSETFGRLFLVDLSSGVPLLADSIDTNEDISQVTYVDTLDLFLVSSFESEQLSTYGIEEGRLVRRGAVDGQGLIAGVAVLPKAAGAHLVVASIHATQGSRIGTRAIDVNGDFGQVTWRSLGEGGEHIPSMVSHSGWLIVMDGE